MASRASLGAVDPLDAVTDLDARAESEGLGLCKGTAAEGIIRANAQFLCVTGLSASAARGWDWLASVHADDRDRVRRSIEAACSSGARSAFPVRMQVRLGVVETLRIMVGSSPSAGTESVFVVLLAPSTGRDAAGSGHTPVTSDRAAGTEPALDDGQGEELGGNDRDDDVLDPYRVLIDALTVPIAYAGPGGTLEFANPAWVAWTGVAADGRLRDALPIDGPGSSAPLRLAVDAGIAWSGRCEIAARDAEVSIAPLAPHHGGGMVVTISDVHAGPDRLATEQEARESERRFRGLVQNLAEGVVVLAADGSVKYSSPPAAQMMGFAQNSGRGKLGLDFVIEEDRDRAAEIVARAFSEPGIQGPVALRIRGEGDRIRTIEAMGHNRLDDPDVGGVIVTARDVSDRIRAETLVVDQAEILKLIAGGSGLTETLDAICAVLERYVDDSIFGVMLVDVDADSVRLVAGPCVPAELVEMSRELTVDVATAVCGSALGGTPSFLTLDDGTVDALQAGVIGAGLSRVWAIPIFDSAGHRVIGILGAGLPTGPEPDAKVREVVEMFAQTAAIAIERQVAEDLLAHRANHDSLTGLPNRVLFVEFLSLALARDERDGDRRRGALPRSRSVQAHQRRPRSRRGRRAAP